MKSIRSDVFDIERGLFQCVKYDALIEAEQMVCQIPPRHRTLLVLEGTPPSELMDLKRRLGD